MAKHFYAAIRLVLFFCFMALLSACKQNPPSESERATFILLGYDSVGWYSGSSEKMKGFEKGSIKDSDFIYRIVTLVQKHTNDTTYKVKLKPLPAADAMQNAEDLGKILIKNGVKGFSLDSLDSFEQKFFGCSNLPAFVSFLNGKGFDFKLNLPEVENDKEDSATAAANAHNKITIILCANDAVYAYEGAGLKNGTKYTYTAIYKYLQTLREKFSGKDFFVVVKPSEESNYNNFTGIMDRIKAVGIEKYALLDLSSEEVGFIKTMK